jgi:thiosulfate dehydrogenase
MLGDDPFGKLVKYGRKLFTDTANEIGPAVSDPAKRLAGNNLACENCHLRAGTQPYAMPLVGVWGQFPRTEPGRAWLIHFKNGSMAACSEV